MRCYAGDEGSWPFGVPLRREAPNHLMLRWLKTVVSTVKLVFGVPGHVTGVAFR